MAFLWSLVSVISLGNTQHNTWQLDRPNLSSNTTYCLTHIHSLILLRPLKLHIVVLCHSTSRPPRLFVAHGLSEQQCKYLHSRRSLLTGFCAISGARLRACQGEVHTGRGSCRRKKSSFSGTDRKHPPVPLVSERVIILAFLKATYLQIPY